ncbi:helix-turn-helix domain-containing protein [Xylophilus sp.]|uniref:helix-turn-helix domain-containing protein n=1 Tax=Xylophilus sp. TaxID=2653893 RepID=UPI0013B7F57C|nr:helix-turn-helix domain-containing protein [Xylophilus sp.]KAF1049348.1 MAG: hypothetical protein GAK38_00804 [Xylophilus sp.]
MTLSSYQRFALTPQTRKVLAHLETVGSITNVEAHAVHGIRSVSRRITELRDAGAPIRKEQKRDPIGQRYVRYVLEGFSKPAKA